jgi:hypothetical protein
MLSVKLQSWTDDLVDVSDQDQRQPLEPAMNADEMDSVEREIDSARKAPLDSQASADQVAYEADRLKDTNDPRSR